MSSTSFLPTLPSIAVAGVLNADPNGNPYMYNWNQVFVVYCSSDSFLGDAGPSAPPAAVHPSLLHPEYIPIEPSPESTKKILLLLINFRELY